MITHFPRLNSLFSQDWKTTFYHVLFFGICELRHVWWWWESFLGVFFVCSAQQTEDRGDSSRAKSSRVSTTEIQEPHTRYKIPSTVQSIHWRDNSSTCVCRKAKFNLHVCQHLLPDINCSSDIDDISRRVQDLVEKINNSRTSDQKVMDSFQEKLVEKVRRKKNLTHASGPLLIFGLLSTTMYILTHTHTHFFPLGDRGVPADEGAHVHGLWREQ